MLLTWARLHLTVFVSTNSIKQQRCSPSTRVEGDIKTIIFFPIMSPRLHLNFKKVITGTVYIPGIHSAGRSRKVKSLSYICLCIPEEFSCCCYPRGAHTESLAHSGCMRIWVCATSWDITHFVRLWGEYFTHQIKTLIWEQAPPNCSVTPLFHNDLMRNTVWRLLLSCYSLEMYWVILHDNHVDVMFNVIIGCQGLKLF